CTERAVLLRHNEMCDNLIFLNIRLFFEHGRVRPCLQAWPRRHYLEAEGFRLPFRSPARLAQDEESRCQNPNTSAHCTLPLVGVVNAGVPSSAAYSDFCPVYDTRQIVPPVSSAISSDPSFITARAAGRPHTSARC